MRRIAVFFALLLSLSSLPVFAVREDTASIDYSAYAGTTLHVYNWGEYISDGSEGSYDINEAFEALTGIKVVYDTFDSNESMYTLLKAGGAAYDVIFPSDYMIGKLISEDMLSPLDYSLIPNYRYIGDEYKGLNYDPDNKYTAAYTFGRVGIIYNTAMVDEEDVADKSWELLFSEKYRGKILQFNNSRDAFATAQFAMGYDVNSTDFASWDMALGKLREQKPYLQGYVMDEIFNKMISGEAAIAPYYGGDFFTMYAENEDLAFYYPEEGTNFFLDAMCIPANSRNKGAAHMYINFLLDPDVAKENAQYICYGCPHTAVIEDEDYISFLTEELHPDAYELLYGDSVQDIPTQIYENLDLETTAHLNSNWELLKTQDGGSNTGIYVTCIIILLVVLILAVRSAVIRYLHRIIDDEE